MSGSMVLSSRRIDLLLQSVDATLARVNALPPEVQAEVSPKWLAMVTSVSEASPWIHWFSVVERDSGKEIGSCGFKGPPDSAGIVEIAYGIDVEFQGRGYATEASARLLEFALSHEQVNVVRAHTLLDGVASQRVLSKCGFELIGEVNDPEDGLVLRWDRRRN